MKLLRHKIVDIQNFMILFSLIYIAQGKISVVGNKWLIAFYIPTPPLKTLEIPGEGALKLLEIQGREGKVIQNLGNSRRIQFWVKFQEQK